MEIEQMALIKMNQTVKYESTHTRDRVFTGKVHAVYGDRAVVYHDNEPHYVTVPCTRLTIVNLSPLRFAGRSA
jgi:hypothetical protein